MKYQIKSILVFCTLVIFNSPFGFGQRIDQAVIQKLESAEFVKVIVVLKEQANVALAASIRGKSEKAIYVHNILQQTAERSQKEVTSYLFRKGFNYTSYNIVNAIAVKADLETIDWLSNRPEVYQIIEDQDMPAERYFLTDGNVSMRSPEPTWGITNIGAEQLWEKGFRGQGVVIGGQDTGYSWNESPIKSKYRGYVSDSIVDHNYNWHDAIHTISPLNSDSLNPCGLDIKQPCDDNNHGTHTMGTMVGSDTNVVIGVAPEATWIGCRNMERGWGAPSTYLECFQWFLAPTDLNGLNPDPTKAPHVINNSWGCPEIEGCNPSNWGLMRQAIINLRAAGTFVVVSAGNDGPNCSTINSPAAIFEESFSIGAYASINVIANFSSRGGVTADSSFRVKPNVSAPGVGVLSVIPGGRIVSFSGTSMAGPHVAGLVALLISANPNLAGEVELLEDIIEQSAIPTVAEKSCNEIDTTAVPNTTYGHGRINAIKALERALVSKVDQGNISQVAIFPNPSNGQMFVTGMDVKSFELYDVSGRLIRNAKSNSNYLDFGILKQGTYMLRLQGNDEVITKQIVIF